MKKLIITSICLCLCLMINLPFLSKPVYASSATNIEVTRADIDTFLSSGGVKRVAYTTGEKRASVYLAEKMGNAGLAYYSGDSYLQVFGAGREMSQNVVGIKRSSTSDKIVIIGAHYDSQENSKCGVYDNASGVVIVLKLMEALKDVDLPYNVVFVFYGAEEVGMVGSKHFVQSMSVLNSKKILLAMNFDSVGVGEHNYFYAGDTLNAHKKLFEGNTYGVESYSAYKRANYFAGSFDLGYSHIGMQSDNLTYIKSSIRSVTFFSGNANEVALGFKESQYHDDLHHTVNDDMNYIMAKYPDFLVNISSVGSLALATLTSDDFYSTLFNIKEINLNFFSDKVIIVCVGLVGLLFVNRFLSKRILV